MIFSGLEGEPVIAASAPSFSSSSCSSSSKWRIKSKKHLANLGLQVGLLDSWETSHVSIPTVWSSTDSLQLYLSEKVLSEELLWLLRQASKDLCQSFFRYETDTLTHEGSFRMGRISRVKLHDLSDCQMAGHTNISSCQQMVTTQYREPLVSFSGNH